MKNLQTFLLLCAVMMPAAIASTALCMDEQRLKAAGEQFVNRLGNEILPKIFDDREIMDLIFDAVNEMNEKTENNAVQNEKSKPTINFGSGTLQN